MFSSFPAGHMQEYIDLEPVEYVTRSLHVSQYVLSEIDSLYVLCGHVMQTPALKYAPVGHIQLSDPVPTVFFSSGQTVHVALDLTAVKVFIGQSEHIDDPLPENWPATHGAQDTAPPCSANVPAGHAMHES